MVNVTLKKEETNVLCEQEGYLTSQKEEKDEDFFNLFRSLEVDENRLTEQKENLAALLNTQKDKATEEVEKRKQKVERLNSEVADLKRRCEKFASWIDSESILECSQAGL